MMNRNTQKIVVAVIAVILAIIMVLSVAAPMMS